MSDGPGRQARLIPGRAEQHTIALLSVLAWGWHAMDSVRQNQPWDLLWMCNLGGLLLAAGWAARSPRTVAVAASWMALGVPLWALDLAAGAETRPSSVLSHLGGLALSGYAVYRLGWPRLTALPASLSLAALMVLCRLFTPEAGNVNLVFEVWPVFDGLIGHGPYLALLAMLATAVFAAIDAAASRGLPPPA